MSSENSIIYTDIEPSVITTEMIKNAFRAQGPTGEAGKLMEEEGYDIHTTSCKHLRLEFLNILRIDHLWMLTGLTKLQLSNNIIEKMENLNELVNLVDLDLSFNRIQVIQNIESLEKLEILTLYQNKIKVLQNLDSQKNLEIFSIGNNLIEDPKCVLYLRKFKKLKSLNMMGNPCVSKKNFKNLVAAYIPQLIYYEYKMVLAVDREAARNQYKKDLELLEHTEAKTEQAIELKEARERELEFHKEAFVEHLDKHQLYEALFENDPEGKAALQTGTEAEEIFEGFKNQMFNITQELFLMGQEQLKLRKEEIRQFISTVQKTKDASLNLSRSIIEDFLDEKSDVFYKTRKMLDTVENCVVNDEQIISAADNIKINAEFLNQLCHEVWDKLMGMELTLFEQLEELNITFERNLGDMVNVFIESAQGYFTQLREQEGTFSEIITDHVLRYLTQITIRSEDTSHFSPQLKAMLIDKDSVHSAMSASHDLHLLVIDTREDVLTSRIRDWHRTLCSDLHNKETRRNRTAILEINHFLDFQKQDFEDLYNKLSDDYLGPATETMTSNVLEPNVNDRLSTSDDINNVEELVMNVVAGE